MIPKDKIYHIIAGSYIVFVTFVILHLKYEFLNVVWASILGFVLSAIAGYLNEMYDEYTYGGYDVRDLIATTIGGFITSIILMIIF